MGTEAFWVPAVLTAVSAAGNAINQSNANKRGQNAQVVAQDNANMFRNQGNNLVKQQTNSIAASNPQADAAKETGSFVNTLRNNVGGNTGTTSTNPTNFGAPTSALGPTPGANKRFNADSASAANQTQSFGNTVAGETSAVDAAIRQRQNEGLQMQTLGTNLNGLNQQAYSQAFVDQLRAQAAQVQSPWVNIFSKGVGALGSAGAANGWFAGANPNADPTSTAVTFDASNPLGMKQPGWTGGSMFPQNG